MRDHRRRAPFVDVESKRMRRRPPPHQQDSRKNEQTEQRKGGWRDKSCADINRRSRCLHIQKMAPTAALVSPLRAQPRGLFVRSCHCLAYDARQPTCVAFSQGRGAHAPYAMTRSASSSDASVTTRTARPSPTSRAFCAPPRRRSARPAVAAGRASPAHGSAAGARKGASPRSAALDPGGGGSSSRLALCASQYRPGQVCHGNESISVQQGGSDRDRWAGRRWSPRQ